MELPAAGIAAIFVGVAGVPALLASGGPNFARQTALQARATVAPRAIPDFTELDRQYDYHFGVSRGDDYGFKPICGRGDAHLDGWFVQRGIWVGGTAVNQRLSHRHQLSL